MRDRNHTDWNMWMDTYKDAYVSFSRAQQEGLRALERFARFQYAVAGDVLDAGLAQAKATLGVRTTFSTQAFAELLEKQVELGTQLSEKIRERAQEFSTLAAEVEESVGSFAAAANHRARAESSNGHRSHAARKAA
jgi:Phasin protein